MKKLKSNMKKKDILNDESLVAFERMTRIKSN